MATTALVLADLRPWSRLTYWPVLTGGSDLPPRWGRGGVPARAGRTAASPCPSYQEAGAEFLVKQHLVYFVSRWKM